MFHPCSFFLLALLAATLTRTVSAALLSPVQSIAQPLSNITISNVDVHDEEPRFGMDGKYGNDNLDLISVLMNTVSALADLAHQPFEGRIRGFHAANLAEYTSIDISFQPTAPAVDIETRIAVLGLYYLVSDMVDTKTFKNADFTIFWEGTTVAQILITKRGKRVEAVGNSTSSQIRADSNESSVNLAVSELNRIDHMFRYVPEPVGKKMTFQEVFITIMATIKELAQKSDDDIAKPFIAGAAGFHARFELLQAQPPPREPPFLMYGWLIDIVRLIPAFMIQNKKFAELMIVVGFEKQSIGKALLEKGPPVTQT